MDDLISRREAIDAVSRGCQEFRGIFAECEKNLNELPAVQTCDDAVSRQQAVDAFMTATSDGDKAEWCKWVLEQLPPTQPRPHYCRECKWSRCHINADKYGKTETYWHCLNWDGGTDEEGCCYEWERRTDAVD